MRPTFIKQPGPALEPRIVAVECRGRRVGIDLKRGQTLLAGLAEGLAEKGFKSGVANFSGLRFAPFVYVIPALSKTGETAAWYSDTFRPAGVSVVENGAITIGTRDGAPFYHCHALWCEADGKRAGGHILPDQTVVAEDATIEVLAIDGAVFDARHDPETNFKLMTPVAAPPSSAACNRRVLALRLLPNQDFGHAVGSTAAAHGISGARIVGGVGSLIGLRFTDGRIVETFATEVFVNRGRVAIDDKTSGLCAEVEIGAVDLSGTLAEGSVEYRHNPVFITFELALEVDDP